MDEYGINKDIHPLQDLKDEENILDPCYVVADTDFYRTLSNDYQIPFLSINKLLLLKALHPINSYTQKCLVLDESEHYVNIAIYDPSDIPLKDFIHNFFYQKKVNLYIAKREEIESIIRNSQFENETVMYANNILLNGILRSASDIHFKAEESDVKIFFRLNGALQYFSSIDILKWSNIKRRFKIISNLNTAEERMPQSGAAKIFYFTNQFTYVRISTHPGIFGENITIRIQNKNYSDIFINKLGLDEATIISINNVLKSPKGLFILAGPVGTGKTTTIYAILKELRHKNIMTIEDPVEIIVPEFKQTDINDGNLRYDECIKSTLRHDPDVLLIGEIRDRETAESAIRASLTGKLVFTTIHAYDSIDSISRFIDLGVDVNYLMPNVCAIMSQRLFIDKRSMPNKRFAIAEFINFTANKKIIENTCFTVRDWKSALETTFIHIKQKAQKCYESGIISKIDFETILGSD